MPPHQLPQHIHRWIRQNIRWQDQRTLQGPLPHTSPQCYHRTPHGPQSVQHSAQGNQQSFKDHQGGNVHPGTGSPLTETLESTSSCTYGTIFPRHPPTLQHKPTNQPTNQHTHNTPLLGTIPHTLPLTIKVGGT